MYNFTLSIPTKMHFGKGQVCQLPADIKRYANREPPFYVAADVSSVSRHSQPSAGG